MNAENRIFVYSPNYGGSNFTINNNTTLQNKI